MVYEDDQFSQPAAATGFKITDHEGELFLLWPTSVQNVATEYGPTDAVQARAVLLTGEDAPQEEDNILIFPSVLVATLRQSIGSGKPVLARVGKGTAKPGRSAPWLLLPFSDEDQLIARKYLNDQWSKPSEGKDEPKTAPASSTAKSSGATVPADKAALAKSMNDAGVPLEQIKTVTQLDNDQLTEIGVLN